MKTLYAKTALVAGVAALGLAVADAEARDPGVPPSVPPGNTLAVPVGASPPPGFYISSRSGYAPMAAYDSNGDSVPVDVTVTDTALQLMWVPGVEVLGGQYKAFVLQPLLHVDVDTPGGSNDKLGLGNTELHPFDVSWDLGGGKFVSTGLSIFVPTGYWDDSAPVVTAGNFWTFAPSVGFSYLADGFNASLHAQYFINTENTDNGYTSGDELLINATLMKDVGGFSFGPLAYYRVQTTDDENNGAMYGGGTGGKAEQFGVGLGVTKRFGALEANVNFTHDIHAKDTLGGPHLFFNLTMPIGGE